MYLLKIKGVGKLPDYVQVRDDDFNLRAFINMVSLRKGIKKNGLEAYCDTIVERLEKVDFNEVVFIKENQ